MKLYILILYFGLICCFSSFAQVFEGRVYDKATMEPIQGVYIYLNGTSIYTTTDSSGVFKLSPEKFINASLVIAHIAYEQIVVENPFDEMPEVFYLEEKKVSFDEVHIVADRYSREIKLSVFKEQFLGLSRAGRSCRIENEEDILIRYDTENNSMVAFSANPLIIHNDYLGYTIEFNLIEFEVKFRNGLSIEAINIQQSHFLGTSSYIDLKPYDISVKRRRDDAFRNSSVYFMKQLSNKQLKEGNFKILNGIKQMDIDDCFIISDEDGLKSIYILRGTTVTRQYTAEVDIPVFGVVTVLGRGSQSEIVFLTNRILVDEYGNIDKIDKVIYYGDMGKQRVGDTLPLDYNYIK